MSREATRQPEGGSLGALPRVMARVLAMMLLLAFCLPIHGLSRLLFRHSPFPRLFLSGINRIIGLEVRIAGTRPTGNLFLLSNHVSWIDIPVLAAATGTAFVGHDGLASMPILRWLCRMNDTVFVARHHRRSVAAQVEQVRTAIRELGALAIFPEGTTSDGKGLLPFKSSLLSALDPVPDGVSILPVWLDYGDAADEIAWVGMEHGLTNFRRILSRPGPLPIVVHFLPSLVGADLACRKTVAVAARRAILQAMHRYEGDDSRGGGVAETDATPPQFETTSGQRDISTDHAIPTY